MTVSLRASSLAGFLLASTLILDASAKPPDPALSRAAVVQALSDCRKIAEDAGRLACYDKAAVALDQAESKGQVVVIDQDQAKAVRRQSFGFRLPTLTNVFRSGPKSGEGIDQLNLDLDGARRDANGRWEFLAADGAVWRQTDDNILSDDPHKGSKLLIKNGLLGSFFCKVDGQTQVRCVRVS